MTHPTSQTCFCPYTGSVLPVDSEGRTHIDSTKGLCKVMKKFLSNETKHRELIRDFNVLASRDPDRVLLAAFGMCGLRAVVVSPGQISIHQPPGMSRKIFREKKRLGEKLAARSLKLVHGIERR